jgi:hypothetical protein
VVTRFLLIRLKGIAAKLPCMEAKKAKQKPPRHNQRYSDWMHGINSCWTTCQPRIKSGWAVAFFKDFAKNYSEGWNPIHLPELSEIR